MNMPTRSLLAGCVPALVLLGCGGDAPSSGATPVAAAGTPATLSAMAATSAAAGPASGAARPATKAVAAGPVTLAQRTSNSATLAWQSIAGAQYYKLQFRPSGQNDWWTSDLLPPSQTSYVQPDLNSGTWKFRLAVYDADWALSTGPALSVTIGAGAPQAALAAPTGLHATVSASGAVSLGWTDNSGGEAVYGVQWTNDGGAHWNEDFLPPDSTSYTTAPIAAGSYTFRVYAALQENAAFSALLPVTVSPSQPAHDWLAAAQSFMWAANGTLAGNDAALYQREGSPNCGNGSYTDTPSSQKFHANHVMAQHPTSDAFSASGNEYFNEELRWRDDLGLMSSFATWNTVIPWAQITLSDDFAGPNRSGHAAGYQGNTRVALWDMQVFMKSAADSAWHRISRIQLPGGEFWTPNFSMYKGNQGAYVQAPGASPPHTSYTTSPNAWLGAGGCYDIVHPYGEPVDFSPVINPWNVSAVVVSARAALVMASASATDDRDASRFLMQIGADYYPTPTTKVDYPGLGTSRAKYVRAKYPDFEYFVFHTLPTNAALAASHPDVNAP